MLRNNFFNISILFLFLYILSIVTGEYVTIIDIAIIFFIFFDKDINEKTLIYYVCVIGILNDLCYGYLLGTTSLVLLSISILRYIFIKNFSYFELSVVRMIYRIIALIQYNILIGLFVNKSLQASGFIIIEHIFVDLIIITILIIFMERRIVIQNT